MRLMLFAVPALLLAGAAAAQQHGRPDPRDPGVKVPPVEYRSALEAYRPHVEPELRDWRKSNEEVAQPSKPQPNAPARQGHGDHK